MAGKAILSEIIPSTSTSASAADLVGTYQVFLSYRGKDTRRGFTDYLYHDLVAAGVHTFRDDDELRVGEEIGPELLKAIEDSKISIPIFSKNYADSKWCLREFAKMVECRANGSQKIYPIFYDVEPSEVQHYERGSYNEAFVKYENDPSLDQETVEQWKKALATVGELKGLELKKETNGHEGALVKIVVQKVLSKLKKNNKHLPETLVGIDNHIKNMKGLLNSESNGVRIIGILGMSGLGKTTIAKAIYNEINELFESHCFLEDVRGESQRHDGLLHLQKQLLPKILKREIPTFDNVDEGSDMIKGAICGKKVFIVLDNVDDKFQTEKLAVNHNWYGAGSRIIMTTTNEEVLLAVKVTCEEEGHFEVYKSYEPELMGEKDALKLFSKCAFKRDSPPEGYLNLAQEVVSNAGGLPLVLETLGSSLFIERDKVSWEEKVKKLKEMSPKKVLERLKISYDALDFKQKQIFLDIACFFVGVHKRDPVYMWDACCFHPSEGIRVLARRSLIKVGEDKILRMHDRLQELGKQIVKENLAEPGEQSRLWDHGEALEVLKEHSGLKKVEALCLNFYKSGVYPTYLPGQDFAELPKLRYLSVNFAELVGDFKGRHSKLRWLEWCCCSGNSTPTNLCLKNLVILNLSKSRITDNWKWWSQIKMAEKLKVLNLSDCNDLARVPSLSTFASLESLQLKECWSLCRLDGLEQLVSLSYLSLSTCGALEKLPDLSKLGKLQTLNITCCWKITAIQGLEKLVSLELLDVSYCSSLERLPNLSNLQKLTSCNAKGCKGLIEIPGLDRLGSLEHLDMKICTSLKRSPDLSNLNKLRNFNMGGWEVTEVQGIGELESLEHLFVSESKCLERLRDLSKLRRLRELEIYSCMKLIEIQGLHGLESLEVFNMYKCTSIKRVTDLSNLKRLKRLHFHFCEELIEISDLDGVESLEKLEINRCEALERLPDLSNLRKLKELTIISLHRIVDIQGLERLESLENLFVSDCRSIERLPDLPNFGMLKVIYLVKCTKLYQFESLGVVEHLESLTLESCKVVGEILYLPNLKNLKRLEICCLEELTEIRGLEELVSLEVLGIRWCESIENIPDLSNLKNLKVIDVSGCVKLTEIRGLEELKSLTTLYISGCRSFKNLLDLPNTRVLGYNDFVPHRQRSRISSDSRIKGEAKENMLGRILFFFILIALLALLFSWYMYPLNHLTGLWIRTNS